MALSILSFVPAVLRALAAAAALAAGGAAQAERVKDLASFQGARANQLVGYGLVVGLDGSGDQTTQTPFTVQSVVSMLGQMGVNLPPGVSLQLRNVAAVMVTAVLPPFARPGQTLDVTVSSLGNAKSLRGGTLLLTPLKGADGQVYALAQGNVVVGGAGAAAGGSRAQVNQLNAGRIPAGATVERAVPSAIGADGVVRLELHASDFGTARRVAEAIRARLGAAAIARDARTVEVPVPAGEAERVAFLAELENVPVEAATAAAKVVINARTGSVVMNQAVTLAPAAVAHGGLSITVSATPEVSQPAPLSGGQTVVTERTDIQIRQERGDLFYLEGGARLADVVKALNLLGATPQDLVSILQALKAAGSLRAELEII
ncbi:MAG: flagellar basal body P-ring protein FlgI [Burkholderiales bacterium]|nr:flagellar basal body P-ring protein FlgI [Burkholderiales bacterium]